MFIANDKIRISVFLKLILKINLYFKYSYIIACLLALIICIKDEKISNFLIILVILLISLFISISLYAIIKIFNIIYSDKLFKNMYENATDDELINDVYNKIINNKRNADG